MIREENSRVIERRELDLHAQPWVNLLESKPNSIFGEDGFVVCWRD